LVSFPKFPNLILALVHYFYNNITITFHLAKLVSQNISFIQEYMKRIFQNYIHRIYPPFIYYFSVVDNLKSVVTCQLCLYCGNILRVIIYKMEEKKEEGEKREREEGERRGREKREREEGEKRRGREEKRERREEGEKRRGREEKREEKREEGTEEGRRREGKGE
jgi:hypothetical protein